MESHQPKYDPECLAMAHRLMEWSNIIVIDILITHRFWAGLILGGCFFGLFSMLPLAEEMYRMRRKERQSEGKVVEEDPAPVIDKDRDKRINQMSAGRSALQRIRSWIRYCKRNNICLFEKNRFLCISATFFVCLHA